MTQTGLWQITKDGPHRLDRGSLDLERHLEDWIESDPALLRASLTIVGRQVQTEAGRLDLLALDPQGRWVIIEIKRGQVSRDTIAQAIDYAAAITRLPGVSLAQKTGEYLAQRGTSLQALLTERGSDIADGNWETEILVVGVGRGPDLERMVEFLSTKSTLSITVVAFEVFDTPEGQRILVRNLTEQDAEPAIEAAKASPTVEDICLLADQNGVGAEFRMLLDAARELGLFLRPYKQSVMVTPPANRSRMLFTVWSQPKSHGWLKLYVGPSAFAEFYPLSESFVVELLGPDGWREMDYQGVLEFISQLNRLFANVAES